MVDDLAATDFATVMLAARGWADQEAADYLGASVNIEKRRLAHAMEKLDVSNRKELLRHTLR